ncbi:uncharacterized protein LOC134727462 [Mytilus trossulus]|uniref:uncharacterized protein LOC134727462 n=1 Tax=Mytilus trossulus TaxID=6551 RepID=UPI0030067097
MSFEVNVPGKIDGVGLGRVMGTWHPDAAEIKPSIESCLTKAIAADGTEFVSNIGPSKCSEQTNFYGRNQVKHFLVDLYFQYKINVNKSARPAFVANEIFGITDVDVVLETVSVTGRKHLVGTTQIKNSKVSNPEQNYNAEKIEIPVQLNLTQGESLCLTYRAKGGGYLVSKDVTTRAEKHIPYDKTEKSRQICYIFDEEPPVFCPKSGNCSVEPVDLSKRLTTSSHITVSFRGWSDYGSSVLASGIESYAISVYEVKEATPETLMRDTTAVAGPHNCSKDETEVDIQLPEKNPMLYAVLLEVKDKANNVGYARRFVLYDNSSYVVTNDRIPFRVVSASNKTNFTWQVHHGTICYSWKNRFLNNRYKTYNPLRPVRSENSIPGVYDQVSGLLTVKGTENVNGLTDFFYALIRNVRTVVSSGRVMNFTSQSICLNLSMNDGDTIVLRLQARDIMNHTLNDSIQVHIDRSVPEIADIWLIRNGKKQLYVHHSSDLSTIYLEFKAFDLHSGIREIKWAFGVYENNTILIEKAIAVEETNNSSSCNSTTTCYCPMIGECTSTAYVAELKKLKTLNQHNGNHNRRYFFTVTATNNAHLVAYDHIDILVDESPPEVGVVLEGLIGSPDIDYTSINEVTVHWHGFIDHESGIKLYRVAIGKDCIPNLQDMIIGNINGTIVLETAHESSKLIFPNGQGKYYVTVIAFNNAMSPSKNACSDGITFDTSVPEIVNVSIKHAQTVESIGCLNGVPWLMTDYLSKVKLVGNECSNVCTNKSNDDIFTLLPTTLETMNENNSVSTFLCRTLKYYQLNYIYTPTDLFQITWNVREDHSQIAHVYVGFGKEISEIDSPDLMGYSKTHHLTSYTQHHPGLIGEEKIFIFIKVQNRAGLDQKIWFGPILADETPPVCQYIPKPVIDNGYVIVKWDRGDVYDTEQTEEIGSVMFRVGIDNSYITPFLEWNIKSHGGQCGLLHQCIKYPVKTLQVYDSENSLDFYIQMHVYNYAGHYCSINTPSFKLPNIIPPRSGVVLDVYPGSKRPYEDVDVLHDAKVYCFVMKGFTNKDIQFEVGVGTVYKLDDAIAFHVVNATNEERKCESMVQLKTDKQYYVTIRASNTNREIYRVSSDGFLILNGTTVTSSLTIQHGIRCDKDNQMNKWNISIPKNELKLSKPLKHGVYYSLVTDSRNKQFKITNTDVIMKYHGQNSDQVIKTFMPIVSVASIFIDIQSNHSDLSSYMTLYLHQCDPDMGIQSSTSLLPVFWSIDKKYVQYLSNYETGLCKMTNNSTCDNKILYDSVGTDSFKYFLGNLREGAYKVFVKPCFGFNCLLHSISNEIVIEKVKSVDLKVQATLQSAYHCINTTVKWGKSPCTVFYKDTFPVGYRWSLFEDEGNTMLTDWESVLGDFTNKSHFKDSACLDIPVYLHHAIYVCLEAFCPSGDISRVCSRSAVIDDPNIYDKKIVYDLNFNNPVVKRIAELKHSSNIGKYLTVLHDNEIDFVERNVKIAGFILGVFDVSVRWFLMKNSQIPSIDCSHDSSCLFSTNTTTGFVNFDNPYLKENGLLYICAVTDSFEGCSDGFLVDDDLLKGGQVSILSRNGYVIEGSTISIQWSGFYGNSKGVDLGYQNAIAFYQYAIGTSIGGHDVQPFTTAGLTDFVVVPHLQLQSGQVYYATIRAFDQLNRSVERHSEGVIYDNTPPSTGTTQVEGEFTYVVKTDQIAVQWFGIEDKESGIVQFEIGIGSTNNSADIVSFHKAEIFTELNGGSRLVDGHQYYAIVKATNGAGLYSLSVSAPFLVDSTGPLKGQVMDISPDNMQGETDVTDIDYQRNTTSISCKWRGFHDPHSQIDSYHVGLGLAAGNDDIEPLTNVGLKTVKTWTSKFVQGVRHYCIMKACNGAKLCSHGSSNGVIIDNSAPIPGLVVVGEPGIHSRYQSDNSSLHATWIGFEDPQSGIDHFEVCIGTVPLLCDIMNRWNVSLSSAFVKSQLELINDVPMFVTVRACNKVKLCVKRSSPSFIIDDTPPVLITRPFIESVNVYTSDFRQIISDPSFFKILWRFEDDRSPIVRTTITISSMLDSHIPISDTVISNENVFTVKLVTDNQLRLGDIYVIKVTACNAALLCSTAHSDEVLLDYSPPQIGGFMPPLSWEVIHGASNFIRFDLSWYGFSDVESKIKTYYISIGYDYSGVDIVGAYKVKPPHQDEGRMQHTTININTTTNLPEKLVFTIWADNYAGLSSSQSKITTDVVSFNRNYTQGNLAIQKHSCVAEYCNNDCTCAVIGQKCKTNSQPKCFIKTDNNGTSSIRVRIIVQNTNTSIVGSSSCLRSEWTDHLNETIWRFEYTFGIQNEKPGSGIFDLANENPWRDVGKETQAIHCLSPKHQLEHKTNYVAYVRAWYSFTLYKIFQSEPVLVDHTSPDIHKRYFVIDSISNCEEDVDYILSTDLVLSCWDGVFYDDESGIGSFMVSVGTSPYADDIVRMHDVGHKTRADWAGLTFEPGTRYFTTVRAINKIGLQTELSSDGFLIDDIAPITGIVYNTGHYRDAIYQSIIQPVEFSWHGFEDEHSFIDSYYAGFIVNGEGSLANDSVSFKKINIHDHIVYNGNLKHGDTIAAMVKTIDKAGHESPIVTSLPLLIDNTPPQSFECTHYEKIYEKHITGKDRWLEQRTCHKNSVYKIKVSVTDVPFDFEALLAVDDMSIVLPFARNSDGSLVTEYNFFSFETALKHFSLDIYGALKSTTMLISVSRCSAINTETLDNNTVITQQISSNGMSVCVRAIDLDSGIKQVNIGIGSVNGGYELQAMKSAMSSSHRLHDIVEANLTHGELVYVQAVVINHAGLQSQFTSHPFVVDHTLPIIQSLESSLLYEAGDQNKTSTSVHFRWQVIDDESDVKFCEYCIGFSESSCGIIGWTATSSLSESQSEDFRVQHGSRIFLQLRCINGVQLSGYAYSGPLVVSYNSPDNIGSKVQFITDTGIKNVTGDQGELTFRWDYFNDLSGVKAYSLRMSTNNNLVLDIQISNKNYIRIKNLHSKNKELYIIDVIGTNIGNISSNAKHASVRCDYTKPSLSGKGFDYGVNFIDWKEVFTSTDISSFQVAIGSSKGMTDIIMPTTTTGPRITIDIPREYHEIIAVVTATSITGMSTTFTQIIKL